jgi:hypothetical protein
MPYLVLKTLLKIFEVKVETKAEKRNRKKQLSRLVGIFVTKNRFSDDIAEGFEASSFNEGFVWSIWNNLAIENKTAEKYDAFLQELRERGLMAE